MSMPQQALTPSNRRKAGQFAWEYNRGELKQIENPLFEKDEPIQTGSEDQTFPEDYGFYQLRPFSHHGLMLDLYIAEHEDTCPYLMKILVGRKEDLIFIPDVASLIELHEKLSMIFGINVIDD